MKKVLMVAFCVATGLVSSASATITFEANYDVNANLVIGTPATGTLQGTASVSGGRLTASATGDNALYGAPTNYFNLSGGWGENTIYGIVRLNGTNPNSRHTLMAVGGTTYWADNYNGMILWADSDSGLTSLQLCNNYSNMAQNSGSGNLVANVDYFIAASWKDNGATVAMRVYSRQVTDLTGTTAVFGSGDKTDVGGPTSWASQNIAVGSRRNNGPDPLMGDVDLVAIANTFTDSQANFGALFNSVVPEPVTLVLLGLGGLFLRKRSA
jgi:hypothetical protein